MEALAPTRMRGSAHAGRHSQSGGWLQAAMTTSGHMHMRETVLLPLLEHYGSLQSRQTAQQSLNANELGAGLNRLHLNKASGGTTAHCSLRWRITCSLCHPVGLVADLGSATDSSVR